MNDCFVCADALQWMCRSHCMQVILIEFVGIHRWNIPFILSRSQPQLHLIIIHSTLITQCPLHDSAQSTLHTHTVFFYTKSTNYWQFCCLSLQICTASNLASRSALRHWEAEREAWHVCLSCWHCGAAAGESGQHNVASILLILHLVSVFTPSPPKVFISCRFCPFLSALSNIHALRVLFWGGVA